MHLTAAPDGAIAVLVAGEILEDRLHLRAVRVGGIGQGNMRVAAAAHRNVPSGRGPRSSIRPSKLEWAALPLNSRSWVRRGQVALR